MFFYFKLQLLWIIPLQWLQWCLGIVASVLSGGVLVRTVLPAASHESKRFAMTIAAVILILHAALALGFMVSSLSSLYTGCTTSF